MHKPNSLIRPAVAVSRCLGIMLLLTCLLSGCGSESPAKPDTTAPTTPENLHVTMYATGCFRLHWSPSSDPRSADAREVRSYKIRRDSTWVATVTDTSWYGGAVVLGVTAYYSVCALDNSSNESEYCDPVQVTPILELAVVVGEWRGMLERTYPWGEEGFLPNEKSFVVEIDSTGAVTGTVDGLHIFAHDDLNPGGWVSNVNPMSTTLGGTLGENWAGVAIDLDFGSTEIPNVCALDQGQLSLTFSSYCRASGEYEYSGSMRLSSGNWGPATASGTAECDCVTLTRVSENRQYSAALPN